ncbi:MAG: DUF937 domain-containing protein [Candidatus Bathyarchaeia archaeon]
MAAFMDEFLKDYGMDVSKQLSSNLGVKEDMALKMIPIVAPMILGGLKRQMNQHGGEDKQARADRANHILNKYGSQDVLTHIDKEFQTRAKEKSPDPRLGGLLGESGVQASNEMSNKFGIDKGTAMKMIVMMAPVILGALSKKRGVGSRGIADLIDNDGDDNVLNDVTGMLFQGLAGQDTKSTGNVMGDLLSQMMQPRCRKCSQTVSSKMKYCPECGNRV